MPNPPMSRDATPTRVGGRYVLRGEIGRGGMATVHRAVDEVLEREVAVKLLHAHLAGDPAFLDRFRREARAAAALAHPNVVAVHDWGESDEGAYLILQLVEGPSLRAVLRRHGRLSPEQVLGVLAPAAAGLGAAHRAGLVHRDVKPENLLLGHDGQVHVTDFGLARAAASATSTFGADVLVGSPHYLSPEAVRGEPLDPRSDVYALGVTLFECLTGRPPHEGDSPFATAVAHTSQRVPPPSSLVEGIPAELDELVVAATSHDPRERPEDGAVFARELALAVPAGIAPLDLHELAGDTIVTARPDAAVDGNGTMTFASDDEDTMVGRGGPPSPLAVEDDEHEDTDALHDTRRGRGWLIALLVLGLLAASAAGGYLVWDRMLAPVTPIPDVVGDAQAEAAAKLESAGFVAAFAEERPHDLDTPVDHVLGQDLTGEARRGARVLLTLSAGPRQVSVPDVVGDTREVAQAKLTDAEFNLRPEFGEAYDDDVAEGLVIRTDPPAAEVVDEASTVTVVVSLGPEPIDIPDVRGASEADARAALGEAGFEMRVAGREYADAAAGTIIGQDPVETTGVRGQTIDVVVSRGPQPIAVPNVRNMLADEAEVQLRELGFEVVVERRGGFGAFLRPNRVFDQDPAPDAERLPGETITIYAYEG